MPMRRPIFLSKRPSRVRRWLLRTLFSLLTLALLIVGYLWYSLRASLPLLDGEIVSPGISQPVTINRDPQGVPVIQAANRADLAWALGFVHAQERFFQMDLLRRRSSGRLSALFGQITLNYDKRILPHQFMQKAERAWQQLTAQEKTIFQAYSDGVNAGLNRLDALPFEYLLTRQKPLPWQPHDTFLVVYSMYLTLQSDNGQKEFLQTQIKERQPQAVTDFLLPELTEWDAPLNGMPNAFKPANSPTQSPLTDSAADPDSGSGNPGLTTTAPDVDQAFVGKSEPALDVDAIFRLSGLPADTSDGKEAAVIGSNNFAVSAKRTGDHRAILAGDMHLGLSVPNIWYRAQLKYAVSSGSVKAGKTVTLTGVTLPGTPLLVAGTNGDIAWTFTNSYADLSDLIKLRLSADKSHYLTPTGEKPLQTHRQKIQVKDQLVDFSWQSTEWGPVVKHQGQWFAYRWIAHDKEAANSGLLKLESTENVESALKLAPTIGIPTQNFTVVDHHGNIGWTLIGPLPQRFGFDGSKTEDWSKGDKGWSGTLPEGKYPLVENPANGQIWTANARTLVGPVALPLGKGLYALGARGKQIRDDLSALSAITEKDMLNVQLDDRALFLMRWRQLMLDNWPQSPETYPSFLDKVNDWSGHADDAGYTLVKRFRLAVAKRLLNPIYQRASGLSNSQWYQFSANYEAPLWTLITDQPQQWLPKKFDSWQQLIRQSIISVIAQAEKERTAGQSIAWADVNRLNIRHPFASSLPTFIADWLNMPHNPVVGDRDMPRAQGPAFGASQRMVISPGNLQDAIFHMPAGQSGHPLSRWYKSDHNNWVEGKASPLLPQQLEYRLVIKPPTQ